MQKLKLNVKFQEVEDFQHPDFTKVEVWVATYGENVNGSNITKEAFEKALPSLHNVPILGEWSESIEDFKGHGGKLEISDDGIKYIETTKPYGVIPENCNPRWEFDEDNVEYLVCDGILWSGRYSEAKKVMENINNQSMEISVLDYEEDSNKIMIINNFNFTGICILGENVAPCFPSAKVVYSLNKDEYKEEFQLMLDEIKNVDFSKGGDNVNERNEIIKKYSYLKSKQYEKLIKNNELSLDELEKSLFALSVNDLERKIREELKQHTYSHTDWWGDTYECQKYYLEDVLPTENIAICEDSECWYRHYGVPYAIQEDSISLDLENAKRYIRGDWREYIEGEKELISNIFEVEIKHNQDKLENFRNDFSKNQDELNSVKSEYATLKSDYSKLEEENKGLFDFKSDVEKQQKDERLDSIFEEFSALSKVDGYNKIFEKRYELEENELVKSLKVLAFDNNVNINKKNKKDFSREATRIPVFNHGDEELTEAEQRYGIGIRKYINK